MCERERESDEDMRLSLDDERFLLIVSFMSEHLIFKVRRHVFGWMNQYILKQVVASSITER